MKYNFVLKGVSVVVPGSVNIQVEELLFSSECTPEETAQSMQVMATVLETVHKGLAEIS